MVESIVSEEKTKASEENSLVCYCYRLTTRDLKAAYSKTGSLAGVEELTRAGTGCTGCKLILQSLFGEETVDHHQLDKPPIIGTACQKPGSRIMKGFIVADNELDSIISSSNAVAPQLGDCDSTTKVVYAVLDHRGKPVLHETKIVDTNETFWFDTRQHQLPRPFYGMFFMAIGRSNFGAARFNIYWTNGKFITSTHENSNTGRPRVFLPFTLTRKQIFGSNTIYFAIMNPHQKSIFLSMGVLNVDSNQQFEWKLNLEPFNTLWINATDQFLKPGCDILGEGRLTLKLTNEPVDSRLAPTVYFFIYNKTTRSWTCNHL